MEGAGHNSAVHEERERLYGEFKVLHEEALGLERRSMEKVAEAAAKLAEIRITFPPRSGWEEWCREHDISPNTAKEYLRVNRYNGGLHRYGSVRGLLNAVAQDNREEQKAVSMEGGAKWARDELEVVRDPAQRSVLEREVVAKDKAAVEHRDKIAVRALAREVAESDDPKQSALHLKRGAAEGGGDVEWYTPQALVSSARSVMGNIDLDPASCEAAQATVKATTWWSKEEDGLVQEWKGRVWLNPPYAAKAIVPFAAKLVEAYADGAVTEACWLSPTNAADVAWAQELMVQASAVCLIGGRVEFVRSDGGTGGSAWASMVLYLGPNPGRFCEVFSKHGACWHRGVAA